VAFGPVTVPDIEFNFEWDGSDRAANLVKGGGASEKSAYLASFVVSYAAANLCIQNCVQPSSRYPVGSRGSCGVAALAANERLNSINTGEMNEMKTILRASLAVLALALLFSTYTFADGAADFKAKCAMCHGANGAGDTVMGKNLKLKDLGSAEVQKQSDAELTTAISAGKGKMPAYKGKLTDAQIGDLVKFIRTLKK